MRLGSMPMMRAISGLTRVALIERPRPVNRSRAARARTSTTAETTCQTSTHRNTTESLQLIGVRRPSGALASCWAAEL